MATKFLIKRAAAAALALTLAAGMVTGLAAATPIAHAAALPAKSDTQTGVTVYANDKASVDASNLSEGYVIVKYTGGKQVRIKVRITKSGGTTYDYDLNNKGNAETFPLVEGNGTYSIKVFENTSTDRYVQAYSTEVSMTLRNEFLPFLYPNQYVNFNSNSKTVEKAAALMKGKSSEVDKVAAVFDYVVSNTSYDYDLAKTVKSGYLPNVDNTLSTKKGICFDYAALMTAMLRSQGIPCKLVIGYAGTIYHAWINVYITGVGWVDGFIYFDGQKWSLMDPTFMSSGKGSDDIKKFIATPSNYTQKYVY